MEIDLLKLARCKERNVCNKIARSIIAKNLSSDYMPAQIADFLGFSKSSVPNFIENYETYKFQLPKQVVCLEKFYECENVVNAINLFLYG